MINPTMTVREVALDIPESTRLFEQLKIDYCCGGHRLLTEACVSAGLEIDKVMKLLADVTPSKGPTDSIDFQKLSLSELIAHIIETHHIFTKAEMTRLEALTNKVINAHGENHGELIHVGELVQLLCSDLKPHMFKEEQVLFPYIGVMEQARSQGRPIPFPPFGTVKNPIRMMMIEHDAAGDLLSGLRLVTNDYAVPEDACMSYRSLYQALEGLEKDLHQHIHLENNILFPRAAELEEG
jgi:regulator of cell morphogenesis and NO signaling